MTHDFVEPNNASRARLETFVGNLTDDDLGRVNADGWSVAAILAHMAQMDQRMIVLLRRWAAEGVSETPTDPALWNDTFRPFAMALEYAAAVRLCLDSAAQVDAALEAAPEELIDEIVASGNFFRFNRALHRADHMEQIARLLGEIH